MQRYIAVFIRQGVRYQRELDLVWVQLAFIGAARLVELIVHIAAVGVFLGGKDSSSNPRAFDGTVLAVGVAVVIIGQFRQIAEFVQVGQAVEIHCQIIFTVFYCQFNGMVDGIVAHGLFLTVSLDHLTVNRVYAVFQIIFVQSTFHSQAIHSILEI